MESCSYKRNSKNKCIHQRWTREKIIEAAKKKKECNAKAQAAVESLIEGKVTDFELIKRLEVVNQCHYDDVVIERAISKICGYPICDNVLTNIPNQRYRISTVHNRVYDISERKNFCSNTCYKASEYLKDQLLTSPLWMRDVETAPKLKLLHAHVPYHGRVIPDENTDKNEISDPEVTLDDIHFNGKDINFYLNTIASEINKINDLLGASKDDDRRKNEDSEIAENTLQTITLVDTSEQQQQYRSSQISDITVKYPVIIGDADSNSNESSPLRGEGNNQNKNENKSGIVETVKNNSNDNRRMRNSKLKKTSDNKTRLQKLTWSVENVLLEWFTVDTLCFLLGSEVVKQKFKESGYIYKENSDEAFSSNPRMHEKYVDICKKLDLLEMIDDENYDATLNSERLTLPTKPAMDYQELQKEMRKTELKVRSFYSGSLLYSADDDDNRNDDDAIKTNNSDDCIKPPVLPLVDRYNQNILRRKIVLDKIKNALSNLNTVLGLNVIETTEEIKDLIYTFSLSAQNIILKPAQWNFLGIILIKLLSLKNSRLKECLMRKQALDYEQLLLTTYQLNSGYFDLLFHRLTDIGILLKHSDSQQIE